MTLLIVIIILALIFDYINGFHDAANSIATVVATKVLTPFQAVVWAAFFNFLAYWVFGFGVADTVAKTADTMQIDLVVILAGIIAAIIWNLLTWALGIPSSSSHTLIGGFAGAAIAHAGFGCVNWYTAAKDGTFPNGVLIIVAFIFLAPIMGMIISYFMSIWLLHSSRKGLFPKMITIGILISSYIFLYYSMHGYADIKKPRFDSHFLAVLAEPINIKWLLVGFIITSIAVFCLFFSRLSLALAERILKRMQLLSSAAFSLGHGGNDSQKVMGIIAAAVVVYGNTQGMASDLPVWLQVDIEKKIMPGWIPLACYSAIAVGTLSGGWKIVKTMGSKITKVTAFEGVVAESAGALTLFVTEHFKIPVSTTHTITGSIIGVGITKRISAVRWVVTVKLLWAWVLTIPISAALAALLYYFLKLFL